MWFRRTQKQVTPTVDPNDTRTQGQIFADEFSAETGRQTVATIKATIRRAKLLTTLALAISIPHQMSHLVALCADYLHFDNFFKSAASVGVLLMAVSPPLIADLLIINCVEQISSPALTNASKYRSMAVLAAPLGVSGYVNFVADGPGLIKFLSAFLVSCIIGSEVLKFAKPDFRRVDAIQEEAKAQVTSRTPRKRAKTKQERILQILADNPGMRTAEVAKKAGVSVNYAGTVRKAQVQTS